MYIRRIFSSNQIVYISYWYIFEPFKIDAIRDAMNYAMKNKDSDNLKNWGIKAQDHVKKNFTIEIMLDSLEKYFQKKINNSIRK